MVKVIKYGKKRRATCKNCGAILEYEKDDVKTIQTGINIYEKWPLVSLRPQDRRRRCLIEKDNWRLNVTGCIRCTVCHNRSGIRDKSSGYKVDSIACNNLNDYCGNMAIDKMSGAAVLKEVLDEKESKQ